MRIVSGLLIVCIMQTGCSSSSVVSSFGTFNAEAEGNSGTIVFRDGRELDALKLLASPDSTHFLNEQTNATTVVSTHTIKKVVFSDHPVGLLEGFLWGAGVGVVTGATLGLIGSTSKYSGSTGEDVAWTTLTLGAIGAAVGGFIGGMWGVIAGHSYEYQFPAVADSTKQ